LLEILTWRALSSHLSSDILNQDKPSQSTICKINEFDVPARRACRSFLPCNISSSSFLFLSSSSWSRRSPSSLMRCRKSLTSSELSAGGKDIVAEANSLLNTQNYVSRHNAANSRIHPPAGARKSILEYSKIHGWEDNSYVLRSSVREPGSLATVQ
jgi:hypothetical protein